MNRPSRVRKTFQLLLLGLFFSLPVAAGWIAWWLDLAPGTTVPNLVTVRLPTSVGPNQGAVELYVDGAADFVVDLAGVYLGASGPERAGRIELRTTAARILDTRQSSKVAPDSWVRVPITTRYVPEHATAVVVNLTVNRTDARGFFSSIRPRSNPTRSSVSFCRPSALSVWRPGTGS